MTKQGVIETSSKCICGNGDEYTELPSYFNNHCPSCNKEGVLQVETLTNIALDKNTNQTGDGTENTTNDGNLHSNKIVCTNCGSEYCGQDGYDLIGGSRASLSVVNPDNIEDGEEETSSTDEGETTYMSGWEGLCDLLKPLDGQVMMVQRGDFVVIKKIEMPQTAKLWAYEGINVVDDSVSITDYTPEVYNTFIIKWGKSFQNELEFVIDKHKQLFGERKVVIEAKKISVVSEDSEENNESNNTDTNTDANANSDGGDKSVEVYIFGDETFNTDTATTEVKSEDVNVPKNTDEAPKTEEVPITTKEEAMQFGLTEVGKAKRENGHTVELKVIGSSKWQMGEWCHVKLPSFNEDSYMFISKCNFDSSADSEYINNVTLVDYPPSLGKPNKEEQEKTNEDEEESDTTGDTNSTDAIN